MNQRFIVVFLTMILFSTPIFSQIDSTQQDSDEFILMPGFYAGNLEVIVLFLGLELGGQFDVDLYGSTNRDVGLGLRASYQSWGLSTVGGSDPGSPYHSLNLYTRFSLRGKHFMFSILGGVSEYGNNLSTIYYPNTSSINIRYGFEAKYDFTDEGIFGLVFKGSSSKQERTDVVGIGIQIGFRFLSLE